MSSSHTPRRWRLAAGRELALDRPRLMAVLNVTPDSFSDGGRHASIDRALEHARRCVEFGADVLDVGGESTRPGAQRVDAREQIRRVCPVIEAIRRALPDVMITVDTTRSSVAEAALDVGADAINDVSAGAEDANMLPLAAARGVGIILMHRVRPPDQDEYSHRYNRPLIDDDVVEAVSVALCQRTVAAREAGVRAAGIALDVGLGFGKTVEQNIALMAATDRVEALGHPILWGASRKSFLGAIAGIEDPTERDVASVAAAAMMAVRGARFFRVHNVASHAQALRVASAIDDYANPE